MKKHFIVLYITLAAFLFSGCRQSPVLEQIIYTQDAREVDPDEEQLDPEDEGQEDERFAEEVKEDIDTKRDTEDTLAYADPDAKDDGSSTDVKYSDTGAEGYEAEQKPQGEADGGDGPGTEVSEDKKTEEKKNVEKKPKKKEKEVEGGLDEIKEVKDTTETPPPEEGDNEQPEGPGGPENPKNPENPENPVQDPNNDDKKKKKVVDDNGNEVEMPEDVQTVTAVGAAASMVEMLGGSGRLVGSGSDLTFNDIARAVFTDIDSINTWWEGSGRSPISDGAFAALLETKPDVCFEMSGDNTFTETQVGRMTDAGISYFVLPQLSSVDQLKTAVIKMAEVLDTNTVTGARSLDIADSYCRWVDSVISSVQGQNQNTMLSSLYIADWVDVTYSLNGADLPPEAGLLDGSTGVGAAVAWSSKKPELISTFMGVAGVTNESSTDTVRYCDTEGTYVMPMFTQFSPVFSNNAYSFYAGGVGQGYDLFLCNQWAPGSYQMLGDVTYPGIIVSSPEVKACIESNWFWQPHGGVQTEVLNWGYGYQYGDRLYYAGVAGDYAIHVNPSGVGDWAEGCVESPLEAYWVAYKFSGQYSLDVLYSEVYNFYQTYFGVSLPDGVISAILGE